MKGIISCFLLSITLTCFSQYSSYKDNFTVVSMMLARSTIENTERPIIVIAKDRFEVAIIITIRKDEDYDESDLKKKSFESGNCNNCQLKKKEQVEKPVEYMLDQMEEGDVWFVLKSSNNYLVELYQPEE